MQQNDDPRKRPLLTPDQLRIMRGVHQKTAKLTPREEFEKLFRRPVAVTGAQEPPVQQPTTCGR
jgi:hypothetical protein